MVAQLILVQFVLVRVQVGQPFFVPSMKDPDSSICFPLTAVHAEVFEFRRDSRR